MIKDITDFRWLNYFIKDSKNLEDFWRTYLKNNKKILYILGSGFDPRMCIGIRTILEKNTNSDFNCKLIDYKESSNSPSKKHSDKKLKIWKNCMRFVKENVE